MSLITRLGVRVAGTLIGRRPGINFTGTNGVAVTGTDNPTNGRVDVALDGAALQPVSAKGAASGYASLDSGGQVPLSQLGHAPGSSSFNGGFLTQSGTAGVGTSEIDINESIPTGLASRAVGIVADAFTANAEARYITDVTGSAITVNSPWAASHTGAKILLLFDLTVTPAMYGAKADGIVDDWRPVQRAILDCTVGGFKLSGGNRIFAKYAVKQPVYLPETNFDHLYLVAPSDFNCDVSMNPEQCILMSARQVNPFTANAATHEITAAQSVATLGIVVGAEIAFNNPYGETLPAGITSGRIYFVKAITGANSFTLSTTSGGTTLNFTTNGTGGYLWVNMTSDIGLRGNILRIDNRKGDLNVMRVTCEQDSSIDTIYIDSQSAGASVTDGSYCFKFHVAQYLNVRNMAIVPGANQQALVTTSTGLCISDFLTINGPASTGMNLSGNHIAIAGYLIEGVGQTGSACIRITGSARNIKLGPGFWSPPSDTTVPLFRDETSGSSTWEFDDVLTTLTSNAFLTDATRVGTLSTRGASIRNGGLGDGSLIVSGMKFVGDPDTGAIIKRRRMMRTRFADAATITTSPEIETYHMDPTGGAQTVNLAGYGEGSKYTVKNAGSANNVTVSPGGGTTLDAGVVGAGTLSPGQAKTYFYSNGEWLVT